MSNPSQRRLASTLHALIIVGMAAAAIGAAAIIAPPSGLGWIGDGPPIAADASIAFDVDFGEKIVHLNVSNFIIGFLVMGILLSLIAYPLVHLFSAILPNHLPIKKHPVRPSREEARRSSAN